MAYHASTDPKTVAGPAGVAVEYTDFNAVNTPTFKSTGTLTASGTVNATGTNNLTGTNKIYFVGSSSNAIGGAVQSSGTTANVPAYGTQYLIPSGSSTPFYQLGAPSAGVQVDLYALAANTSHPIRVYTAPSSALTVPYLNGGLNGVHSTSNNYMLLKRGTYISLMGHSTTAWVITNLSTISSTELTSFSTST